MKDKIVNINSIIKECGECYISLNEGKIIVTGNKVCKNSILLTSLINKLSLISIGYQLLASYVKLGIDTEFPIALFNYIFDIED